VSAHPYHRMCGCSQCDAVDLAGEAHDERAAEIVDAWMTDPAKVAEALDELSGTSDLNSDGNTHFSADLAVMLDATGTDALQYVERLRRKLRDYFQRDAEVQAADEAEQFWQRGDEGRRAA
jgi:hypothetical protein